MKSFYKALLSLEQNLVIVVDSLSTTQVNILYF